MKKKIDHFTAFWILACCLRLIAAVTHSHWAHPDEWHQTIELGNLIANGFGLHCQEVGLHLRNLTLPSLFAGILKLDQLLFPNSIDLRFFSINVFCGFIDLGILWGWIQLLHSLPLISIRAQKWSLALLLLPWFTVYPSVNPRGEHFSEIALWVTLGCLARQYWLYAGVASIAIFAFRYPSILLNIGLFLSVLLAGRRPLFKFILGSLLGLILFGFADAWIYGRPWESFWMYLQYNLFTGSGHLTYGKQSMSEYASYFWWEWGKYSVFLPLGVLLAIGCIYGLLIGLIRGQPWALCLVPYLIGHLWVGHKEGRFMAPIETLSRWLGFIGIVYFLQHPLFDRILHSFQSFQKLLPRTTTPKIAAKVARYAVILFLAINSVILLHELRSDLWKPKGTLREMQNHLSLDSDGGICGVLSPHLITSLLLPFHSNEPAPSVAMGRIALPEDHTTAHDLSTWKVFWFEKEPRCELGNQMLVHTPMADSAWNSLGCHLLPSGILKLIPSSLWNWTIEHHLAHGSWYRCPPSILQHFKSTQVAHLMSSSFGKMKTLPPLGITALDLKEWGRNTSPPPADGILPLFKDDF